MKVKQILEKIIRPAPGIRSRFHDCQGIRVTMKRIALNFPRAMITRLARRVNSDHIPQAVDIL